MSKEPGKYYLYSHWRVHVSAKVMVETGEIDFSFEFFVEEGTLWVDIWGVAKKLLRDRLGIIGWTIKSISLSSMKSDIGE